MPDDIRLSRWDLVATAGVTKQLSFTSPTALTSLSIFTGGTVTDVDDTAGATRHTATLSPGGLTATVELAVPTGSSTPLRLAVNGVVQTVGTLTPSTSGTSSADNTITLAPADTTYTLTVLGVVESADYSALEARVAALEAEAVTVQ